MIIFKKMASEKNKKNKKLKLVPLADRVIIEPIKEENIKTESGIILQDSSVDKETKKGLVVAVGEGRIENGKKIALSVKVGQKVIYSWGDTIKYDGVEYIIVKENDISAIIG